ncbi:MAG: FtsW/RodA/SpoVE family cell cycle protein [Candidatus Pacebacteria bacterium]|nr:FtsW/RodA/SpoVE family cell cycle protein [Candidatus Paceibacterota bacterium]
MPGRLIKFNVDWILFSAIVPLLLAGLVTMRPFTGGEGSYFFTRQVIWIFIGVVLFFAFSRVDWRFLKTSGVLLLLFGISAAVLLFLLAVGKLVRGASSWFDLFFFSVEPAEPIKLFLILLLAKYFSRRHIEIANFKHIAVSGLYAGILAFLVFLQPDFGSAAVFFFIWFGMSVVSGLSKKHLLLVFSAVVLVFLVSWIFVLKPYQKERISTFLDPLRDPQGSGYNALQSMIAVGSGQILGKGLGFGTQSRLEFLPEYRTDFIFAAFSEEWGFVGVFIIFLCFGILIWRILRNASFGPTNFERLFGAGLSIFLFIHFVFHVGMNIGVLPITGLGMPFISYGGSQMVTVFAGLGILMGMRKYSQRLPQEDAGVEFLG